MSILERLGLKKPGSSEAQEDSGTETVRRIVEKLERMDPAEARYVAAFAYLLGRVANADLDISARETREMERLLVERAGLSEEQAVLVTQMAKSHARLFGGTENFLVTREFDRLASREQKLGLIRSLFAVAAADDAIATVEDNEIRQIASELHIDHRDYTAIKADFRDRLSVLKKP